MQVFHALTSKQVKKLVRSLSCRLLFLALLVLPLDGLDVLLLSPECFVVVMNRQDGDRLQATRVKSITVPVYVV